LILSLPAELARQLHIVPLISIADQMVVAAAEPVDGDQWMAILEATGMDVRFVLAEPEVIEAALDVYYPRAA
jgi:cobalamin biosynthesis Co2+ chelatase CbiK